MISVLKDDRIIAMLGKARLTKPDMIEILKCTSGDDEKVVAAASELLSTKSTKLEGHTFQLRD